MVDYWGTTADPNYGYSPYSGRLHYGTHQSSDEPFTSKPGSADGKTIEEIRMRIRNMHPEKIAELADHWQNAWSVMDNVRTYVLGSSNRLEAESWQSPKARDAFLGKGPGEVLAYLDVWMDAAQQNVTALRHLVQISITARADMDALWAEYERALQTAQNVDLAGQLSEWFNFSERYWTTDWEDAKHWQVKQQVDETVQQFQQRAQELAYRVGNEHYEYTTLVATGVGPPYRPMDAVLNTPGNPALVTPPSLGGPGGVNAPNPVPSGGAKPPALAPTPVAPPATAPKPPATAPTPAPAPTLPTSPPAVVAPPAVANPPTSITPPGVVPPAVAPLPAPPPAFAGSPPGVGAVKPSLPGSVPSLSRPPGLGTSPAAGPATSAARPPNPGQLTRNAFNRGAGGAPQSPGAGQPPGRSLRRPTSTPGDPARGTPGQPGQPGRGAPRQPGRGAPGQPGRGTPVQPPNGQRRRGEGSDDAGRRVPGTTLDGAEQFGRPGGTTPPVLKNPTGDRNRVRPGSQQEMRPPSLGGTGGDAVHREGTAPPVLQRPTRTPETPAPSRGRPGRKDGRKPAGADWIGADQARTEAGAPVIDAPAPPPSGSRVSKLEEVPKELRSRAATRASGPGRVERPGTVAPELNRRRTSDGRDRTERDDEARGVVTDEQAFEVQTPGGGVVTSKREEHYEPEIRRILGGR
ncbi:hypothetical protein [Actinoplanes sp. NBRC 101535]|uniref:hypothetical protein n=1 Tax=Actinoplanes sp. NBRC 101535 TaxID=3032196 RepID=UPI0024A1A2FA|nr:hypothetical protein [Actinoplanes sp. NBRC 101535]GLY01588.1 hypothetical protein Acsp01_19670 [Actinoplanes sp. NBRC 101535]